VFKEGRLYWKCEHLPKTGSTPDIPLDPRQIPDEIDKILKKKGPSGPTPGPVPGSGRFRSTIRASLSSNSVSSTPSSANPPQPPSPPQRPTLPTPGPQLGILWTDQIHFEQVRLIGHASSESTDEYNQALATRRVNFVMAALTGRGFGARVADPLIGDGAESGCQRVGAGLWSCGNQGRPEHGAPRGPASCGPPLSVTHCRLCQSWRCRNSNRGRSDEQHLPACSGVSFGRSSTRWRNAARESSSHAHRDRVR
jgi:hypothetical protein